MCKNNMGAVGALDTQALGMIALGAIGSKAITNPLVKAIWKPGGKTPPKYAAPILKLGMAYLLWRQNEEWADNVMTGVVAAAGLEMAEIGMPEIFNPTKNSLTANVPLKPATKRLKAPATKGMDDDEIGYTDDENVLNIGDVTLDLNELSGNSDEMYGFSDDNAVLGIGEDVMSESF